MSYEQWAYEGAIIRAHEAERHDYVVRMVEYASARLMRDARKMLISVFGFHAISAEAQAAYEAGEIDLDELLERGFVPGKYFFTPPEMHAQIARAAEAAQKTEAAVASASIDALSDLLGSGDMDPIIEAGLAQAEAERARLADDDSILTVVGELIDPAVYDAWKRSHGGRL